MATIASRIYDEGTRLIDSQRDELDNVRARTGTLLAAASLVTVFLGSQALAHDQVLRTTAGQTITEPRFDTLAWVALALFIAVATLNLVILWPWTWGFSLSPTILRDEFAEGGVDGDVAALELYLATVHERNWDRNNAKLDRLLWCFRGATLCLVAEVFVWVLSLPT